VDVVAQRGVLFGKFDLGTIHGRNSTPGKETARTVACPGRSSRR
jgi:hypothetical protein